MFDAGTNHSGHVSFEFENLLPGAHQIFFSAWDNSLNRASVPVRIVVTPKNLQIIDPMTYPNPAPGHTAFTFSLTHDAKVTIKIYTVAGRLIRTFDGFASRGFNRFPEEDWECTDEDGDFLANGLYLYKIIAQCNPSQFEIESEKQRSERIGRMIVMR
ncbi:MAG: T9SS type A sorting domain-containing protein [Calditrichaeota bacterium]|nr:T9SS type A sorting domain-containing protein [Calditrichota bacterium]